MSLLCPTPRERMLDAHGRPYFLWDSEMTLERFEQLLASGDEDMRAYLVGKLMRQAKPDDVFTFVSLGAVRALWPRLVGHLGRTRNFWTWCLTEWKVLPRE